LLLTDMDPDDSLLGSTLTFVDERFARLTGLPRIAVSAIEWALSAAFAVVTRGPMTESPRAVTLLRRLDATTLPPLAAYVRLVRSLTVVYAYETRAPMREDPVTR